MSLEAFIDIRFADPVLCLSLNAVGLIYGSALGRVVYYNVDQHEETVISEFSEECARGVYLSQQNDVLIYIGDLYYATIESLQSANFFRKLTHYDRVHTQSRCSNTHVLQHEHSVIFIEERLPSDPRLVVDNVLVVNTRSAENRTMSLGLVTSNYVPVDFDGYRLLGIEWNDNDRVVSLLDTTTEQLQEVLRLPKNWGEITQVKLAGQHLLLVRNHRELMLCLVDTREVLQIGKHKADIVALGVEASSHVGQVFASVDKAGVICLWDQTRLLEKVPLLELAHLTPEFQRAQLFSLGYPYCLALHTTRLAVSTDHGVLVVRSRYLDNLSMDG